MKKLVLVLVLALSCAAPAQAQRQERGAAAPKAAPQPQKAGGRDDMRRDRFSRQERDRLRQDLLDANRDMKGKR